MRKISILNALGIALSICMLISSCKSEPKDTRIKVLLDTDMVEGFDDGVAMMMLLGSDNINLLGVTTETGNDWATEGVAYGIRQMEISGATDVPIIKGSETPVREGRYETLADDIERATGVHPFWYGGLANEKPSSWKDVYMNKYGKEPSLSPTEADPIDFIIKTIKENPNEITLVAIGPTSNIAKALTKAPEIASLTKEIVYMGGAFYCEGNTTPDAELNVFYDPEAEKICFRAPWPKQTIVSLDICNTVQMNKTQYENMLSNISNEDLKKIFTEGRINAMFEKYPDSQSQIWDTISAALVIDPSILQESNTESVDVNTDPADLKYGKTFVNNDDESCQKAIVPTKIDNDRFWGIVNSTLGSL